MTDEIASREPLDTDAGPPTSAAAVLVVAVGGSAGTALRYLLSTAIPPAGGFPVGIFVVNLTGAALLGFLTTVLVLRGRDSGRRRTLRLALGTGVLGGYTTYSALATDTADLILDGRAHLGTVYAVATVLLGALATWSGVAAARKIGHQR